MCCVRRFVTYKWPSWLHKQAEKQRIIWAYKILFLDVLFPLGLKKVRGHPRQHRATGLQAGRLAGWIVGRLDGWMAGWMAGRQAGWLDG